MKDWLAAGSVLSRRTLSQMLGLCVVVSCILLVVAVVRLRTVVVPLPAVSHAPLFIEGFHSAVYDGDHLRLRISGDSLTVSNLRLLGPFSLGFMQSLLGRNITLETFPTDDTSETATAPFTQALSLDRISGLLAAERVPVELAHAELGPLRVIEHRHDRETTILEAASCRTALTETTVVCEDGVINTDGRPMRFAKLSYDPVTHRIQASP
jgi:hypothetical protein